MKRNDTLIKINLLGKEFLAPTHRSTSDASQTGNPPRLITALLKKLAQQVRNTPVQQ